MMVKKALETYESEEAAFKERLWLEMQDAFQRRQAAKRLRTRTMQVVAPIVGLVLLAVLFQRLTPNRLGAGNRDRVAKAEPATTNEPTTNSQSFQPDVRAPDEIESSASQAARQKNTRDYTAMKVEYLTDERLKEVIAESNVDVVVVWIDGKKQAVFLGDKS